MLKFYQFQIIHYISIILFRRYTQPHEETLEKNRTFSDISRNKIKTPLTNLRAPVYETYKTINYKKSCPKTNYNAKSYGSSEKNELIGDILGELKLIKKGDIMRKTSQNYLNWQEN